MRNLILSLAFLPTLAFASYSFQISPEEVARRLDGKTTDPTGYEKHLQDEDVQETARSLRNEIREGKLKTAGEKADWALSYAVPVTLYRLDQLGDKYALQAGELRQQWDNHFKGFISRELVPEDRHQGDHKPLIQFLVDLFELSKAAIGLSATKMLHISDLATFSWSVPVIFRPTTFPMDLVTVPRIEEYRDHFALDNGADGLYGLTPVVTWWVVTVGCMAGTSGIGAMICGPLAAAGEYVMGHWFGPPLSDWVYHAAGGT